MRSHLAKIVALTLLATACAGADDTEPEPVASVTPSPTPVATETPGTPPTPTPTVAPTSPVPAPSSTAPPPPTTAIEVPPEITTRSIGEGRHPIVLAGTDGLPAVVYGNQVRDGEMSVEIAKCLDRGCRELSTKELASGASSSTLVADLAPGNHPVVAFSAASNDVGTMLMCSDPLCSDANSVTVDVSGGDVLALGIGTAGNAALMFFSRIESGYRISLLVCDDELCSAGSEIVVDEFEGSLSLPAEVAFATDGSPLLFYNAGKVNGSDGADGPYLASCIDPLCSAVGEPALIAKGALVAARDQDAGLQLLVDRDGSPGDQFGRSLELMTCSNSSCTELNTKTLDVGTLGHSTSGALVSNAQGSPVVLVGSHANELWSSGHLRILECRDGHCSQPGSAIVSGIHVTQFDATAIAGGGVAIVYPRGATDGEAANAQIELMLCQIASCRSDEPMPTSDSLVIEAFIDGTSRLILRGDTAYWHHLEWAAPGLWEFSYEPTTIGNVVWFPRWPESGDSERRFCECATQSLIGFGPALPLEEVEVAVTTLRGDGLATVIEHPSAANDYSLVLEFRPGDGGPDSSEIPEDNFGADWYLVEVEW